MVLSFAVACLLPILVSGLASSDVSRARLEAAFASPSGKLTFAPEVVIPEPNDPTAILLMASNIQTLSEQIRTCKTNAAFVQSSLTALQTFAAEQEQARGSFPGPVSLIYCGDAEVEAIAEAGADGVLVKVCEGNLLESVDEIASEGPWRDRCKSIIDSGLQPVPEVTLGHEAASKWTEDDTEALVARLSEVVGVEPVCMVVTVDPVDEDQEEPVALPPVSKELRKKLAILGSVRVMAGENRVSMESMRFKDAGYNGAFLRSDCVPGFRMQLDLRVVGQFWSSCIGDLKSTRSKSFSFRSKNNMEMDIGQKWMNYKKRILDDGALGDMQDTSSINSDAGDYQGFA